MKTKENKKEMTNIGATFVKIRKENVRVNKSQNLKNLEGRFKVLNSSKLPSASDSGTMKNLLPKSSKKA